MSSDQDLTLKLLRPCAASAIEGPFELQQRGGQIWYLEKPRLISMWLKACNLDSPKLLLEFYLLTKFLKPVCQFSHL